MTTNKIEVQFYHGRETNQNSKSFESKKYSLFISNFTLLCTEIYNNAYLSRSIILYL